MAVFPLYVVCVTLPEFVMHVIPVYALQHYMYVKR